MLELNEKLFKKLQADYKKIREEYTKDVNILFDQSYYVAMYNQVADTFFDFLFCENCSGLDLDDQLLYEEEVMNKLIKFEGNIIEAIVEEFTQFRKPDRWDFWGYYNGFGGTYEVINECIETIQKEIK